MKEKKHLSFPSLIAKFRQIITEQFPDSRSRKSQYPLADVVLSGFACMFFQDASMLQFQKRMEAAYKKSNLSTLFGVELIPEETQLRDLIDKIPSLEFSKVFKELFFRLQRGKHLEQFKFYQGSYLVSIDGTQYFTSKSVSCEHCLKKEHRTGEITHSHQALQAAIAHPELKQVIPLMAEDIRNEDGKTKQDCEINAGKRLLGRLRSEHPQLDTIVLGDALYSKQPMVEEVKNQGMHYIFGVKPDDHKTLYKHLEEGLIQQNSERDGKTYLYRWKLDVPLNAREEAVKVNSLLIFTF